MTRRDQESSTTEKFDDEPCKKCGHPKGIHNPQCWAFGLVEPKCRKKCYAFERDNLVYLEREYTKTRKAAKKAQLKKGRYSRGNTKGVSYV